MEVETFCSANALVQKMWCCSVFGPSQNYIFLLLILSGTLLRDVDVVPSPSEMNRRFLLGDPKQAAEVEENKDAGENDDDDNDDDEDDDENSDEEDEDESDGDEGDSDDEVETNGDAGSDDEDDDDDSEDEDDDDDDDDNEEDDEEED